MKKRKKTEKESEKMKRAEKKQKLKNFPYFRGRNER
jgi:hypothetical protein